MRERVPLFLIFFQAYDVCVQVCMFSDVSFSRCQCLVFNCGFSWSHSLVFIIILEYNLLLLLIYASHFRPLGLIKKLCLEWSFVFCVSTICQVAKTLKQIIETQTRAKWLNL